MRHPLKFADPNSASAPKQNK